MIIMQIIKTIKGVSGIDFENCELCKKLILHMCQLSTITTSDVLCCMMGAGVA